AHGSRVAFATKSEVDHLDDGYRWRKYGQKAVKNSSFPRYYLLTFAPMCMCFEKKSMPFHFLFFLL
uniref:WRKY domain-containing protein n=1 Tax=Aegilops tauschii subsp. strangulata TaxID=200361 RepID=A0A453A0Z7_AEGTS